MTGKPNGIISAYTRLMLVAFAVLVAATASATHPNKLVLADFEFGVAPNAVAVDPSNAPVAEPSNSAADVVVDEESTRLRLTDTDGGVNGAVVVFPGAIPAPGYYLITADVKVDNSAGAIHSFGMSAVAGGVTTVKIADPNAGYVMNLASSGDAAKGYQTIGAAINIPSGGTFPQDLALYFGTDVSGNDYNALAGDGDFSGIHRSAYNTWPAGSASAVYVDNICRFGPGNFGEERHLWISVGDGFTDLAKLENILVAAKANNFGVVDILARYRADAYYVPNRTDKTYYNPEPLGSRIGNRTVTPETDPLQYAIDRGHELGLKVYISFSSFLVTTNGTYPSMLPSGSAMWYYNGGAPRQMLTTDPNGSEGIWADPSRQDVRDYSKNILMDIVKNYDIDGVIFDRVRFPSYHYSYNPQGLADMGITGTPSLTDTAFRNARRDVITTFLHDCYEAVTSEKPWVVVGATPICTLDSMSDTYNQFMQFWPKWTAAETRNRRVSFGCIDLIQPQLYRLATSTPPYNAPDANTTLFLKALYGDKAVYSLDYGLMPGATMALAPTFYHPSSNDLANSNANAQNIADVLANNATGFGLFAATTTLNDIAMIRSTSSNSAGIDVLAPGNATNDYFMKAGYDNIAPLAPRNFTVTPQADGEVILSWDQSEFSPIDGDHTHSYLVYRSKTTPVKEYWANLLTKSALPCREHWDYSIPRGTAGTYYYKLVAMDDYNNEAPAVEVGPVEVGGDPEPPADIIVDNLQAAYTLSWASSSWASDKYATNYQYRSKGTGAGTATFSAAIPVTGTYAVYEWHSAGTNRAGDAQHIVTHAGGSTTVIVNQQANGGKWNLVGQYQMTAGQTASVKITDLFSLGTSVMADGIKWVYVPPAPPAPPTPADIAVDNVQATKVGTWSTGTGATDKYMTNYYYRGKGTGTNYVTFTAPITVDGIYDVYEWHSAGTNRAADAQHVVTFDGGSATVLVNQQVNGGKWNKIGSFTMRANQNYTVTINDIIAVSGQMIMADGIKWVYSAPIPSGPPADVIVDNVASVRTGTWATSSWAADKFATNYYYRSTGVGSANKATFTGSLLQDGVYDVYEWHPAGANRAAAARHTVSSLAGQTLVQVNQQVNGGKWNLLGRFQMTAGTQTVTIDDNYPSGSIVTADAIKWSYVEPLPEAPAAPWDVIAMPVSQTEVALIWDDASINETGFVVERDGVVVATLPADSEGFVDTGLTADTEYMYAVRATIGNVKSCVSNVDWARTLPYPPAAPEGLVATIISESEASLAWADASNNEAGFEVLRNGQVVANLPADSVSFNDTGLEQCTEYTYAVRAFNAGGVSADSNAVVLTIDLTDPTIEPAADVTVSTDQGLCSASNVALGEPQAADNCGVASVTNDAPAVFPKGETVVTWTVVDIHGNSATATQKVTVADTEKPVIECPADVHLLSSVDPLVPATYEATATDNCGEVTVTFDPPSGSGFAAGETEVTCTATDAAGNVSTCTFKVVRDRMEFSGFLSPIGGCVEQGNGGSFLNPVRSFKINSTIPVKFQLASQGVPVTTGAHRLTVVKYTDETTGEEPIDATPTDAATEGNLFRLTDCHWHFNLATRGIFTPGTYLLIATMSDGSTSSVWIQMR